VDETGPHCRARGVQPQSDSLFTPVFIFSVLHTFSRFLSDPVFVRPFVIFSVVFYLFLGLVFCDVVLFVPLFILTFSSPFL
jgi:hypothetical protein